jgi:hypothetical protein
MAYVGEMCAIKNFWNVGATLRAYTRPEAENFQWASIIYCNSE